jgi:hypothetical protein
VVSVTAGVLLFVVDGWGWLIVGGVAAAISVWRAKWADWEERLAPEEQ